MITIWHNPRCSKSRQTLALIEASGMPHTVRKYLEDFPTLAELKTVQAALGVAAIKMLRPTEKRFKEMALTRTSDADTLLNAAAANPVLIERPIVISDNGAVIGRPPETVQNLL